jgi:hypothetical protein
MRDAVILNDDHTILQMPVTAVLIGKDMPGPDHFSRHLFPLCEVCIHSLLLIEPECLQ